MVGNRDGVRTIEKGSGGKRIGPTKEADAKVGTTTSEGMQGMEREACTWSFEGHNTSMQSEKSRQVTDNRGGVEPTKRQARTEREVGLEVDYSDRKRQSARKPATSPRRTRLKPVAGISHILLPSWHIPVDVQVWWGRMS